MACQCEITWLVPSAVLLCDDMFNVVRKPAGFLPQKAILTAVTGPLADKTSRGRIH